MGAVLLGASSWFFGSLLFRDDSKPSIELTKDPAAQGTGNSPALPSESSSDSTNSRAGVGAALDANRTAALDGRLRTRSEATTQAEISALEIQDAASARGRPFPISQSITRRCTREGANDPTCRASRDFVRDFQVEERNILWARDREERIERSINALGAGRFVIRSLECRTNRCAVEVAANGETYIASLESDAELQRELVAGPATMSFEEGEGGTVMVVTLMGFTRRAAQ
jgi:hypothetical protein